MFRICVTVLGLFAMVVAWFNGIDSAGSPGAWLLWVLVGIPPFIAAERWLPFDLPDEGS